MEPSKLASNVAISQLYDQLRRLAGDRLRQERPGHTLSGTALVHEAYLRLTADRETGKWETPGHFFAAAAEAMRRILIENARRKRAQKHGGDIQRESAPLESIVSPAPDDELLALDEALDALARTQPVQADLVKLRYFVGMTADEAAQALGISASTGDRYWAYARAWLHRSIRGKAES